MTTLSAAALVVALLAAITDWWAVAQQRRPVELVAKPAVLVALIAAAVTLTPADPEVRVVLVIGLVLGLIGDVLLMFDRLFIPGAAAFLLGHVAYLIAFLATPQQVGWLVAGAVILGLLLGAVARPIIAGARQRSAVLGGIVVIYLVALGAVLVFGVGTANLWVAAGVVLFAVSDALLAYGRFVGAAPGGRVAVHVTYHLAQALLVLSLLTLS